MDYSSEEKITEKALAKTSVRLNQPGDVLIAMYGATIGTLNVDVTNDNGATYTNIFTNIITCVSLFAYQQDPKEGQRWQEGHKGGASGSQ